MVQIVNCRECGAEGFAIGQVTASIQVHKSSYCDHCRHDHSTSHTFYFCSLSCMCAHLANPEKRKRLEFETEKFRQNRLWSPDEAIVPGAAPVG